MPPTDLQQAVLELVGSPDYRPMKPKVMAKRLGINQKHALDLKRIIKVLIKQGKLAYGPDHFVFPVKHREETAIVESASESPQPEAKPARAARPSPPEK